MTTSNTTRRDLMIAALMLMTAGLLYWFSQGSFYVDRLKSKGAEWSENTQGEISRLDLSEPVFRDRDLKYLESIPSLKDLNLEGTSITDIGLGYLALCPNIERLNLTGTKITNEGMHHLSKITNLRILYLNDTAVTYEGLQHLVQLPKLQSLAILNLSLTYEEYLSLRERLPKASIGAEANHLLGWDETSPMEAFLINKAGEVRLISRWAGERIVPPGTVITKEFLKSFPGKEFVTFFHDSRGIPLTAEAALELENFPNLRDLSISGQMNHQILQMILGFSKLERLSISSPTEVNPDSQKYEITYADLESLSQLKKLRKLWIRSLNAKPTAFKALRLLSNLEVIQFHQNELADADILFLKDLEKLQWVYMRGNQLTEASLETLKKMPNLLGVDLEENQIDPEKLAEFKKFLRDRRPAQEDDDSPP